MFALAGICYFLALACGIASLVFFIMVVVQMFKRDQSTLGIVVIVLTFCGGIGPLIALVYGWIKATEWNLKKTMTYWTAAIVAQIVLMVIAVALAAGGAATMDPNQFNIDPNNMEFEFDIDESDFEIPDFEMPADDAMPEDTTFDEPSEATTDQP